MENTVQTPPTHMAAALKLGGAVLSAIHQRGLENGVVDSGNATTHGGMARAGRCTRLSGCSGRVWPDDGPSPIITDTSGTCRVQLARAALLQKEKARENCGWRTTRPTSGLLSRPYSRRDRGTYRQ